MLSQSSSKREKANNTVKRSSGVLPVEKCNLKRDKTVIYIQTICAALAFGIQFTVFCGCLPDRFLHLTYILFWAALVAASWRFA